MTHLYLSDTRILNRRRQAQSGAGLTAVAAHVLVCFSPAEGGKTTRLWMSHDDARALARALLAQLGEEETGGG